MVNRLLGALAEDDIYSRTLFHRWGDFSERVYARHLDREGGCKAAKLQDGSVMAKDVVRDVLTVAVATALATQEQPAEAFSAAVYWRLPR